MVAPDVALAEVIAARSESLPLSCRFITVNVLGTVRSSRTTHRGKKAGRRGLANARSPLLVFADRTLSRRSHEESVIVQMPFAVSVRTMIANICRGVQTG
jgi:hypothetical protein